MDGERLHRLLDAAGVPGEGPGGGPSLSLEARIEQLIRQWSSARSRCQRALIEAAALKRPVTEARAFYGVPTAVSDEAFLEWLLSVLQTADCERELWQAAQALTREDGWGTLLGE